MRRQRFKVSDFEIREFESGIEVRMNKKEGEPDHILIFNQDGTITLASGVNLIDPRFKADKSGRIKINDGNY